MYSTGSYLKKAAAAFLLGLFAFILAEKNTHEHTRFAIGDMGGQTMVHQPGNCLICDFQLAADADMPFMPDLSIQSVPAASFSLLPPSGKRVAVPDEHSLRGPPALAC